MSRPDTTDTTPNANEVIFTEGDSFRFAYAFTYASGNPRPITGWVLRGNLERLGADGAPSETCPGEFNFDEARDDALGTGFVNVEGFETLTPGTYSWATSYEIPADETAPAQVKTFASGTFKIRKRLP